MKKMRCLLPFLMAMLCNMANLSAQLEMGGWQTMFSYYGTSQLTQSKDKIYAVSNGNMFSIDKEYNSIELYSKLTGLSDGEISLIEYNESKDVLLICYSDLNIDILKNGEIFNIPDLKNKEIQSKTVNSISFDGNKAYLSCGFGIMEIDLAKIEISNTYNLSNTTSYISIESTVAGQDSIYAVSSSNLYVAPKTGKNLNDYKNWSTRSLPEATYTKQSLAYGNGKLQLFRGKWFTWNNGWQDNYPSFAGIKKGHVRNGKVTIQGDYYVIVANEDLTIDTLMGGYGNDAVYDENANLLWIASDSVRTYKMDDGLENVFCPDGPIQNEVSTLKYDRGKIISAYGQSYDNSGIVQIYDNDEWTCLTRNNIGNDYDAQNTFFTVYDVALDPTDKRRMFVATWRSLFEFYDNKLVKRYYSTNTSLSQWATDTSLILLTSIMFDKDNTMWLANAQADNVLKARDKDGAWHTVYYSNAFNKQNIRLFQSNNGLRWVVYPNYGPGVFVIKDNGTPFTTSDDKTRMMTSFTLSDGSTFTPTSYKCITEDKSNNIWIGTDMGPLILKNTASIFNSDYTATRIKITRDDDNTLADYLLSTEMINAIEIDGANRKWIATEASGLYLLSEDGQETIKHFTKDNSPLTTNKIKGLALDPRNGKLYISTLNGLFVYQSDARKGETDLEDIHVFPNPVKPGYDGNITVNGLMEDTEVRITDALGHVVCHGESNGGYYVWDGYLANGNKAATGVYFVYAKTTDGQFKNVCKFAIIKR